MWQTPSCTEKKRRGGGKQKNLRKKNSQSGPSAFQLDWRRRTDRAYKGEEREGRLRRLRPSCCGHKPLTQKLRWPGGRQQSKTPPAFYHGLCTTTTKRRRGVCVCVCVCGGGGAWEKGENNTQPARPHSNWIGGGGPTGQI